MKDLIKEDGKVSVLSTLRKDSPVLKSFKKLPFEKIKDEILGKKYECSIVLVGPDRIHKLNRDYRQKNKATDVLSFSISETEGEIFICLKVAALKAKKIEDTLENYLIFLVIHAMLHLKGLKHGDKMERYELAIYSRYRHRHL